MPHHLFFPGLPSSQPEAGSPSPDRIVSGQPTTRTWTTYEGEGGRLFCGVWEATPGAWRVSYDEWESCTVLEGRCTVTPDGGDPVNLGPGDTLILEPGFKGIWSVTEKMRKTFVIRL